MFEQTGKELGRSVRSAWWIAMLRGVAFVLLGALLLLHPVSTVVLMVWVFGIYMLVDGTLNSIFAIVNHKRLNNWGLLLLVSLVEVVVGLFAWTRPTLFAAISVATVLFWIGVSLIVVGLLQFWSMYQYKSWSMFFGGLLTIILGGLYFSNTSGKTLISVGGVLMIVWGLGLVYMAFQLEKVAKKLKK